MFSGLALSKCWNRSSYDAFYAVADAIGNAKRKDLARASSTTLRRIHAGIVTVLHAGDEGARSALRLMGNDAPYFAASEAVGGLVARMQVYRSSASSVRKEYGQKSQGAFNLMCPSGAIGVCESGKSILGSPLAWSIAGGASVSESTSGEMQRAGSMDFVAPSALSQAWAVAAIRSELESMESSGQLDSYHCGNDTNPLDLVAQGLGYKDEH